MSENDPAYRTVMRGYDPAEVKQHVTELRAELANSQRQVAALSQHLEKLTAAAEQASAESAGILEKRGRLADQIMALVETEATQIRAEAIAEVEIRLRETFESTSKLCAEADLYVGDRRARADRDAELIVTGAKRAADEVRDHAERHATAQREEAAAMVEKQRAASARAMADFEQTLAVRRDETEQALRDKVARAERQVAAAEQRADQLRAEADRTMAEVSARAAEQTAESERHAEQIIAEATARADRIRAETEHHTAAASQRRDSINAQLASVRQMLSTIPEAAGAPEAPRAQETSGPVAPAPPSTPEGTSESKGSGSKTRRAFAAAARR